MPPDPCLSHQVAHTGLVGWPGMLLSFLQMLLAESKMEELWGHGILIAICSQCHNGKCLRLKRKVGLGTVDSLSCVVSSVNTNPTYFIPTIYTSLLEGRGCSWMLY